MKALKKNKMVTFDQGSFDELKAIAKVNGRSVEAQIRHYVNYGINNEPNSR